MYRIVMLFAVILLTSSASSAQTFSAPTTRPVVFRAPIARPVYTRAPRFVNQNINFRTRANFVQFQNNRFQAPVQTATQFARPWMQRPQYDNSNSGGRQTQAKWTISKQSVSQPSMEKPSFAKNTYFD